MNDRVAQEYSNYGDIAAGLRVFVEQLNEKNRGFDDYVSQIDAIDQQVTEFEAVVSMLDKHIALLEKKVKSAYHISSTQWFPSTDHTQFLLPTLELIQETYILAEETTL